MKHHRLLIERLASEATGAVTQRDKAIIQRDEALCELDKTEALLEDQDNIILQLEPIMKERGRRVFGNLKQSKPSPVVIEVYPLETAAVVLSPVPGGHLVKAYIVESKLDFTCLKMALDGEGKSITLNGHPVICKDEIVSESDAAIQKD